jgi:4-hydroxy-4-methyl-2-oxoglutarate aldolase
MRAGDSLRSQLQLRAYLDRRAQSPGLTFRDHLRAISGAVEE